VRDSGAARDASGSDGGVEERVGSCVKRPVGAKRYTAKNGCATNPTFDGRRRCCGSAPTTKIPLI
jgi:hypothetical protein